jgi:sugar phosphate isomerase/epimerase
MGYVPSIAVMIKSGFVSITLRKLKAFEVLDVVADAGLSGIEWGGDVHVPHGDLRVAETVGEATREKGLAVAAYGSYYRCVPEDGDRNPAMSAVLDSAEALGVPSIRIWAGTMEWNAYGRAERNKVLSRMEKFTELAAARRIQVGLEYHNGTLTQTEDGIRQVLEAIPHPNLYSLWQPVHTVTRLDNLRRLEAVLPRLSNVHVFQWGKGGFKDRQPLEQGADDWKAYLEMAASDGQDRWAMLEFVKNDDPANVASEAKTLNELILDC